MPLTIGIDLGTSGSRAVCIDEQGVLVAEASTPIKPATNHTPGQYRQYPDLWWHATEQSLLVLCKQINTQEVRAICTDGTSSTLLLSDDEGNPLAPALMYNDSSSLLAAEYLAQHAPNDSPAQGPSSSLSKLIALRQQFPHACHAMHQADWITGKLSGHWGISDTNNCLKLGYDPVKQQWPDWIEQLGFGLNLLPKVQTPGTPVGIIKPELARQLNLQTETLILSGTTDSTAAFIATGASRPGEAVTSLGSTLVTKVISPAPVFDSRSGIYSHRVFDFWITGGASNSGGTALLSVFTLDEIETLSTLMKPEQDTGLDYYPLPGPGERFPVASPDMQPRMPDNLPDTPSSRAIILQGLFEGIARIEADAYKKLHELGAPYPKKVISVGGGSANEHWNIIRQRILGIPVIRAQHHEAAYGAALLAMKNIKR